jgi:hypothetical protein
MRNSLKKALKPIYKELLSQIDIDKDIYTFCSQWGKSFADKDNKRILFVGKATNGWVSKSTDVETLFGNDDNRIFDRSDQMEWVNNLKGNTKGYNTNNSAFWRVIKKTAQNVLKTDNAIPKIAWSNIYKISYHSGNPDSKLKKMQKEYCKLILEKEIELMSPKYVVFLTSGWEKVFFKYLNNGIEPIPTNTIKWKGENYSKSYEIGKTTFITSSHPQGKNEEEHVKALTELLT